MSYASICLADSPDLFAALDETTGTSAADQATPAHNGIYSGSYTLGVTGPISGHAAFRSTGGVAVFNGASYESNRGFSAEVWFNTAGTGADTNYPLNTIIRLLSSNRIAIYDTGSNLVAVSANNAWVSSTWNHVVVTIDASGNAILYLNGSQLFTGTNSHAAGGNSIAAGSGSVTATDLAYAAHYPSVLTATQVSNHYNASQSVPGAPTGVSATPGDTTVTLNWTQGSGTVTQNKIFRGASAGGESGTPVATISAATTYTDTGLTDGTTYYYYVKSSNGAGDSSASSEVITAPQLVAPAAPTALTAVPSSGQIVLTWTNPAGTIVHLLVYRSTTSGAETLVATLGNVATYTDAGLINGTEYFYTVAARNSAGTGPQSAEVQAVPGPTQYLPAQAVFAQSKGSANPSSPLGIAYSAFISQLDANLNTILSAYPAVNGIYEGNAILVAADYAAGYVAATAAGDSTRASKYADKAIGAMLYGCNANQRADFGQRALIARGDGATTAFTIPNSDYVASTLGVWTAPIAISTIIKGAANGQDNLTCPNPFYQKLLKVSNTNDGTANYIQGTDWRYNPNYITGSTTVVPTEQQIDWSLAGTQPATSATYYVTSADLSNMTGKVLNTDYTVAGTTVTFAVAPAAGVAVFFSYVYGTWTGGASTLGFQMTTDGRGGINNAQIDTGFTSRYFVRVAQAFDWIYGYTGFSSANKATIAAKLQQWSDYIRDHGYVPSNGNAPASSNGSSNYVAGHFSFRNATAIALAGRDTANGLSAGTATRLKGEVQALYTGQIVPPAQAGTSNPPVGTNYGGQWTEGWNYGAQALRIETEGAIALESYGWGSGADLKRLAGQSIYAILHGQMVQADIYDGGDGYAYPEPLPPKNLLYVLAKSATDSTAAGYANYIIQNYSGGQTLDWVDLCYRDPNASASNWTGVLPLSYQSTGCGVLFSRKAWDYASTWLSFHCGNMSVADHQAWAQGALEIWRGVDDLLVLPEAVSGNQAFKDKSHYANLVSIDDLGAGTMNYPSTGGGPSQGLWYASPNGCTQKYSTGSGYVYSAGDYSASWEKNDQSSNPTTECVRSVIHASANDHIVVYDRVTTVAAGYAKQLQWHFNNAATVTAGANGFTAAKGSSKLFGKTYSGVALTSAADTVTSGSTTIKRYKSNPTTSTAAIRYATALQPAPSATGAMDATTALGVSVDGKNDGVLFGHDCFVFGVNGAIAGSTSYSVTDTAAATTTHYVSDLSASTNYTLTGATQSSVMTDSAGVATFTSTGTGLAQTLTLSPSAVSTTAPSQPQSYNANAEVQTQPDLSTVVRAGRYDFHFNAATGSIISCTEGNDPPNAGPLSWPKSLLDGSPDVATFNDGSRSINCGHFVIHFTLDGHVIRVA